MGTSALKTTFVDTLFVVAVVNQRDQYHGRAVQLAVQHKGERFLITEPVLLEIGNALARNFKAQAIEALDGFLYLGRGRSGSTYTSPL